MTDFSFGRNRQVHFDSQEQFFYALGFLANNSHAEIIWEHNEEQGAWASEGRIHCLVPPANFPQNFTFTAGNGNVYARINCNDFVRLLIENHNFACRGLPQDIQLILSTVPQQYHSVFMNGYNA